LVFSLSFFKHFVLLPRYLPKSSPPAVTQGPPTVIFFSRLPNAFFASPLEGYFTINAFPIKGIRKIIPPLLD
jgi:hypothetical protein